MSVSSESFKTNKNQERHIMSNAKEVGTKLAQLCREGKGMEAIDTFYAANVISVESVGNDQMPREMTGKEAVLGKAKWWVENHEIHSAEVTGPFPHGDEKFALRFNYDVTNKPSGQRIKMDEIAVYEVADGKVVREEFFYDFS